MQSYVCAILVDYRTTLTSGQLILDDFRETFEDWDKEHFAQLNCAFKRELIKVLYKKQITPIDDKGSFTDKLYHMLRDIAKVNGEIRRSDLPSTAATQPSTTALLPGTTAPLRATNIQGPVP